MKHLAYFKQGVFLFFFTSVNSKNSVVNLTLWFDRHSPLPLSNGNVLVTQSFTDEVEFIYLV